jgi:hypothetical protein
MTRAADARTRRVVAQVHDAVLPENNLAASVVWGCVPARATASLRKLERAADGGVTVLDVLGPQQR